MMNPGADVRSRSAPKDRWSLADTVGGDVAQRPLRSHAQQYSRRGCSHTSTPWLVVASPARRGLPGQARCTRQTGPGARMHVEASPGVLLMRFGVRFTVTEAERLQEAVVAFAPFRRLTLDFSNVRHFEDAAVVPLARTLSVLGTVEVRMRGLTLHQERMLEYIGHGHGTAGVGHA